MPMVSGVAENSANSIGALMQTECYMMQRKADHLHGRCVDWSVLYPVHCGTGDSKEMQRPIDFADIGCGFGGLLVDLVCAPLALSLAR